MLCSVPSIEQASLYADEGIIVFAEGSVNIFCSEVKGNQPSPSPRKVSPLCKPISVTVDGIDCFLIGNRHMVRLDSDKRAVLLVCLINCQESLPGSALEQKPKI